MALMSKSSMVLHVQNRKESHGATIGVVVSSDNVRVMTNNLWSALDAGGITQDVVEAVMLLADITIATATGMRGVNRRELKLCTGSSVSMEIPNHLGEKRMEHGRQLDSEKLIPLTFGLNHTKTEQSVNGMLKLTVGDVVALWFIGEGWNRGAVKNVSAFGAQGCASNSPRGVWIQWPKRQQPLDTYVDRRGPRHRLVLASEEGKCGNQCWWKEGPGREEV